MPVSDENTVFVGNKKPTMNYVLAVITQFNKGTKEVSIKARGRAISKAVDVAEITRERFLSDVTLKNIEISTESIENEKGQSNVSAMTITLAR
ncbi:MAG: DNA-binding protein Alba [Candidatus Jordarchaeaceae archaeon]